MVYLSKALILMFVLMFITPVFATEYLCNNCTECSTLIQSASAGDIIRLNTSVYIDSDYCIDFNGADNVIFDCDNYNISGGYSGIYLHDGSDNNTIRNCFINGNGVGITFYEGANNTITNVTASYNNDGIFFGGNYNKIINVTLTENSGHDIMINHGPYNCNDNLINVTGSGNRPIKYYNYSVNIANEVLSELILCNANYSNVTNVTIRGSGSIQNNGMFVHQTSYSNFSMINSSYTNLIWILYSHNNSFTNVAANNNYNEGFEVSFSDNNTFVNVTANYNGVYGFYLSDAHKNTFINTTANINSQTGFVLSDSDNNTFVNVTANNNEYDGIYLAYSGYNTIKDSRIENNTEYGISLSSYSWGYARYNTFYNNLINATSNYILPSCSGTTTCDSGVNKTCGLYWNSYGYGSYEECCLDYGCTWNGSGCEGETTYGCQDLGCPLGLSECSYTYPVNFWNTTLNCTAGPNIIGGSCIGGNFWIKPSGRAFSDDCIDLTGDGICDSTYTPATNNTDSLPLTNVSVGKPCSSCTNCSSEIQGATAGMIVRLNTSLINQTASTCINFNGKDNVTFDCNSYVIDGNSTTNTGIYLSNAGGGSNNNNITNCVVNEFGQGIYIYGSENNTITNCSGSSSSWEGSIYIRSGRNNTVINCNGTSNPTKGISLYQTTNNTVINYSETSSQTGVSFSQSSNNTIINFTGSSNGNGILFVGDSSSYNNSIYNSTINQSTNSDVGFYVTGTNYVCTDLFSNVTGSGGYPIKYINYPAEISNEILSELILCNANNSVITNVTIMVSSSNHMNGLYIFKTHNATFSGINASKIDEVVLYNSSNNTFNNIILDWTDVGIYMQGVCNFNNFTNVSIRYSDWTGFYMEDAYNNTYDNVTIFGGDSGFEFYKGYYNIVKNSRIENTTYYGIYVDGGSYSSQYNLFYNNLFNNTLNVDTWPAGSGPNNTWNTTLDCSQTNIIGGPCIGGNFWTNPSGNGFSDVCNDTNENYICDETYTPLTNNTDYLALWRCKESWTCGDWSQCVAGAQNRTCTDRRSCGTTYSRPSLTQSCVMPGGPGGSSSSSSTTTINVVEEKKTWSVIKPDEGAKMTIDKKELGFTEITIAVNNEVSSTTIQVSKVESKPAEVSKPSENVYQYVQIKKNIEDEQIKESKIKFKVEKKWLSNNKINKLTVKLNRYKDGWNNLTTRMLSDDDNYVYYESESPGFSLFAITGDVVVCEAGQKRCLGNEIQICDGSGWNTTDVCPNGCDAQTIICKTLTTTCTSGETRCAEKRIEVCANGVWNTQQICEHGCVGAACIVSSNKEEHDFLIYAAIFLIAAVLVFVYVKMTAEKMEKEMFIKPQKK
jgi:PGF-pre-PGF domain-containing protein